MLASLMCLASASPWACRGDAPAGLWQLARLDVAGLQSDDDAAWVQQVALQSLRGVPQLHVPVQLSLGADEAGQHPAPAVRIRLHVGHDTLQLSVVPALGFGAAYDDLMPLAEGGDVAHMLDAAIQEAMQAVMAMHQADLAGLPALRRWIDGPQQRSSSPDDQALTPHSRYNLQSFAVRRVAQLRDFGALTGLRALVQRAATTDAPLSTQALGLQAVGSLVALCDGEAVLPMIALAQHKEAPFVVQMAHAIGAVGGPMAEAYLVTLASGHLDGEVRREAALALQALGQRKALGGCG